ncbi:MAG: sugar ABC transporter permease [Acetatifactor sp.]|nr:sugar ABC transporter permease [Acetatifactor sp.]
MKKKSFSYAKWGYIFSIPFAVAFLAFMLYPIVYTIVIGFTNMKGMIPPPLQLLSDPFENFKIVLADPLFKKSLVNTFVMWILNFIPQILLALLLAAWFTNERMKLKGKGFFKVVFYMPNIITQATVAILFNALFMFPKGPVNDLLISLGIRSEAYNFGTDGMAAKLTVAFIQFWMWYGYTMIVLISGILGISPDIFEAADIDGANGFQRFIYVTLPNLKTIMLFTLVTSLIGGLTMYDIPKLYLDGGPNDATRTASVYIQKQAFSGSYMYNTAAAASMIMFLIIGVLAALLFFLMRDKEEAALHKRIRQQEKAFKKKMKEQKGGM